MYLFTHLKTAFHLAAVKFAMGPLEFSPLSSTLKIGLQVQTAMSSFKSLLYHTGFLGSDGRAW